MPTYMGAGASQDADGFKAGQNAAKEALQGLADAPRRLVIAFVSTAYDLSAALAGIREVTGDTPLIGCTSYGEFANGKVGKSGVSVSVLASTSMQVNVGVGRGLSEADLSDVVAQATATFDKASGPTSAFNGRTLMLFMDGLVGGAESLIQELMTQTGMRYQLFGGAAADDISFAKTYVLHNGEFLADAFVCAEILSERPFGVALSHGWTCASDPMRVTSSEGMTLQELNGEPAWDAYVDYAGERGLEVKAGGEPAFLMQNLIGIQGPTGTKLRVPLAKHADGAISCVGEIPQGSIVHVMEMAMDDVLSRGRSALEEKTAEMGERGVAGVLTLECAAMQLNLQDDLTDLVQNTRSGCGDVPVAGCSSYGQLARIEGGFEGLADASSLVCVIPA